MSLLKIDVTVVGLVQAGTCRLSGSTLIAMVQTANFWEGYDVDGRGRLYGPMSRAVLAVTLPDLSDPRRD
jgi:hypothetical protein